MDKLTILDPTIPKGSTIFVTGVNGLIASHVADQILAAGYKVRGTVRSVSQNQWLASLFSRRYESDSFQMIEMPDLTVPGIFREVLRGVSGVVSVAGFARPSTVQEIGDSARDEIAVYENLLGAAADEPSVKSFAFTSSAWAAWTPKANTPATVTKDSWNELSIQLAGDAKLPDHARGFFKYMAVKMKVEQAIWAWVKHEQPHFAFNAVLPDTVLGPILDAERQGGSTAGFVRWLWSGENLAMLENVPPQWFIDGRDLGRLYLATLISGVDKERIFGFAGRYSWSKILDIMREMYPEKDFLDLPDAGWDQTEVPNDTALALLRSTGQEQWTTLRKSVEDGVRSFVGKTSQSSEVVV